MRNMDAYAREYKALPYEDIQENFRRVEIAKALERFQWHSLVEVGCGNQSIVAKLSDFRRAVIIEPIHELLEKNLLELKAGDRLDGFHGFLSQFESKSSEKFDVCVLSSILHEIENQSAMLHDCWSILNTQGKLIVNVPNAMSLHRIIGLNKGLIDSVFEISDTQRRMQQHTPPFSTESLKELLVKNGFSIECIYTVIPKLFDHQSMKALIDSGKITLGFLDQMNSIAETFEPFGSEIIAVCNKAPN